jgi:glyoxylate/hydroxypyruvate reductase A
LKDAEPMTETVMEPAMDGMRVVFCCTGTKAQPWLDGLRAALPGAAVSEWQADAAPPELADYAVVWAPPQQFLDQQTGLKAIFNIGAGVDALMKLQLPPHVPVVRLDDAGMSVQMAEYVCHAVIRHFREFDGYAADVATGKWSYRKPNLREDFPIGVLGLGVLGQRVCAALGQFDFPLRGWSRSAKTVPGVQCFSGSAGLTECLAGSRILVCLLPLTPELENILNQQTLGRLLPGGYLINVARGGHLVDDDLIALLDSGQLSGATLDVFREEPLPITDRFWRHPKITLTPHTSARTLRGESIRQIAGKIQQLENGSPIDSLAGVVNPKQGY